MGPQSTTTRYWVIGGLLLVATVALVLANALFFPYRWPIAVMIFGAAVGASELVGRYKDAPFHTLWTPAAGFYAAMNAAAALGAFILIQRFKVNFGYADNDPNLQLVQAMVAGFGAMAFFRSSLFTIKVAIPMFRSDREYSFRCCCSRPTALVTGSAHWAAAEMVTSIMNGVSFSAARDTLPDFCFELMQNLPAAEAQRVRQAVDGLASAQNIREGDKSLSLGLMLMNVVGTNVLEFAVRRLGPRLQEPAKIEARKRSSRSQESRCWRKSTASWGSKTPSSITTPRS